MRGRYRALVGGLALLLAITRGAHAAQPEAAPGRPPPSLTRRTLSLGAALVPGLVLHGAGHVAVGDRSTGLRLLAWEGIGLGAIVVGLGGLAVTGASSRTVGLFIPMLIGGAGLFGTTWLSDVYGVAANSDVPGTTGVPRRPSPIEMEAGLRYVYDRVFTYRTLAVVTVDLRRAAFRVTPSAWLATNGSNQRLRVEGAWRLVGADAAEAEPGGAGEDPNGARAPRDGSFVDLEVAATHHRYGAERFAVTLGEIAVGARLDLRRAAGTLAGSFVEGALGWAVGGTTYFERTTDYTDLLLGRLGWGVYWGGGSTRQGEAALFYDHRHDGYTGGMKMPGLGSGVLGSVGVRASGYLSRYLGVGVDARVGSAYLVGASLLVRPGGAP